MTKGGFLISEMDQTVKRMQKLIEEDGDSFAKKAEMYYKKRPELITLVDDFSRMYRSLAERYDHVTGELRRHIPADLRSQGSVGSFEFSSEPPSSCPSPPLPDFNRLIRRRSGPPRPPGFDFFGVVGTNNSEFINKEDEFSSTLDDSDRESVDSSVNNYSAITNIDGGDQGLKDKYRLLQEQISGGCYDEESKIESSEIRAQLAGYEEELKVAREKIRSSEGEINRLNYELQRYRSFDLKGKDFNYVEANQESLSRDSEFVVEPNNQIHTLEEELSITKSKHFALETEVARLRSQIQSNESSVQKLQDQLKLAQKENSSWKAKLEKEKREVLKLQDRITRYKSNIADRDQEIRGLREAISNANKTLSEENSQLQAEISQLLKEKAYLEDNIKETDLRCQSLEEDVRRFKASKAEMEALLETKHKHIQDLNTSLDEFAFRYDDLLVGSNALDVQVTAFVTEFEAINEQLYQLQMDHAEAIDSAERTCKRLTCRVTELEQEVKKQQEAIIEGAEEKREAIRQLCFSLEHYRNGYHMLRKAII